MEQSSDTAQSLHRSTPATIARPRESLRSRVAAIDLIWVAVASIVTVVAAFLFHQLMAWPPHEDEALALLVGRGSLSGVVEHVTRERGGAPAHFVLAWAVAHLGLGLGALRTLSAVFALASIPLIALLGMRLAGRRAALLATAFASSSWVLLFHGVYGRMYSLFLFLSLASFIALLRALDAGGRKRWTAWLAFTLLCVAAHPYGALVVGSQAVGAVLLQPSRVRVALPWFATLAVAGIPFWLTDIVLAGRFDVGVGGGGSKLSGPVEVLQYLYATAGDMTAGWTWILVPVLLVSAVGLLVAPPDAQRLSVAVGAVPVIAFFAARLGSSTAPESRHLIFALPFLVICLALGTLWLAREITPAVAAIAVVVCVTSIGWAWHKTPPLFEWEPEVRQAARADASAYLARMSRPDDLMLGYDPLFLNAWERDRDFPATILPRADATLALRELNLAEKPLGHGVWVLDRSDTSNYDPQLFIADHTPLPEASFVTENFGPFLVIRTSEPVRTIDEYLFFARQAMFLGQSLGLGDADVNRATIEQAQAAYDQSRWGASSSTTSR